MRFSGPFRNLSLLLMVSLLLAACTAPVAPAPTSTSAPPTMSNPTKQELIVFAAASLTESFKELGQMLEATHPDAKVLFNFAGSQQLRAQLEQGAPADVFASANKKEMDAATGSSLVIAGTQEIFARNRLVVIYPQANPGQIATLADLAKPGLKLVVADKGAPVGQYTLDMLNKMSQNPTFGPDFADNVLKNVVSLEQDVKGVVAKVQLGEADAGVVYSTDVAPAARDVTALEVPDAFNQLATYPIAVLAKASLPDLAQQFVDLVLSDEGQAVLNRYGFTSFKASAPPSTAAPAAADPVTVTDALGRQVTFQELPRNIVVTGKALFMLANAIYAFPEASQRIAALGKTGQSKLDWIPIVDPNYKDKTIIEGDAGPEQIAAVQPDAVLLKSSNAEKLGKPLETLGIPVVYMDFETPEQYQRDLATLGQIFGNPARAQELAAYYQAEIDKVTQATGKLEDNQKPKVLLMYYTDRDGAVAFNVPPLGWMQTMMVQMAGGQPVWQDAQLGNGWTKVNLEQIAAWEPDQIYIVAYYNPVNEVVAALQADPQWQQLSAVKDGQLYGFPGDYYSWDQADTRWTLGLKWLAGKIQPDLFRGQDIDKEARTFYRTLYNLDDAAYDQNVKPNLTGSLP